MLVHCKTTSFVHAHDWHPDPCLSKERWGWWTDEYQRKFDPNKLVTDPDYYPFELADLVRFVGDLGDPKRDQFRCAVASVARYIFLSVLRRVRMGNGRTDAREGDPPSSPNPKEDHGNEPEHAGKLLPLLTILPARGRLRRRPQRRSREHSHGPSSPPLPR
jgi:hypothetical protein